MGTEGWRKGVMKPPKGMTPDEELLDLQKKYHLLGELLGMRGCFLD